MVRYLSFEMASSHYHNDANKNAAWQYARLVYPNNKNNFICNFCNKVTREGVLRAKKHLAGGYKDVKECTKCPQHVHEEII